MRSNNEKMRSELILKIVLFTKKVLNSTRTDWETDLQPFMMLPLKRCTDTHLFQINGLPLLFRKSFIIVLIKDT